MKKIKCLSETYKKGEYVIHPLLLLPITNLDENYCLTMPYLNEDGEKTYLIKSDDKISENKSISKIEIDSELFLNYFYNINNFNEGINWLLDNISLPENTINRFLNNFWNFYINDIKINFIDLKNVYFQYLNKHYNSINKKIKKLKDNKLNDYIEKTLNKILKKYNNKEIEYNTKFKKHFNLYLNKKNN